MFRILLGVTFCLFGFAAQAMAQSDCASVDQNLNIDLPCIAVGESFFQGDLIYYANPADPGWYYWQLGPYSQTVTSTECASLDDDLTFDIPCLMVNEKKYKVSLGYYKNPANPYGHYWSLIDVQPESPGCSDLTFTKGDAIFLESSAIFPGIVDDGNRLIISFARGNELYVRPYDSNFSPLVKASRITTTGAQVTDHKHIYFQGYHYLVYSTLGDSDLFLMKLDQNLVQVGKTVTVTQGSSTTRTNDMLLGNDGTQIIVGQFRPSDRNNFEPNGHLIKLYDTNLNLVSADILANAQPHTNTAAMALINGMIYLVAPSNPVQNPQVQTQRNLLLIRYDTEWNVQGNQAITLVEGATLTHKVNGDGIWMSTGLAYDESSECLIVGHTFTDGDGVSDNGQIYLRTFTDGSFQPIHTEFIVESGSATRAHFLLLEDVLYVVYDDSSGGSPSIYGLKYTIGR